MIKGRWVHVFDRVNCAWISKFLAAGIVLPMFNGIGDCGPNHPAILITPPLPSSLYYPPIVSFPPPWIPYYGIPQQANYYPPNSDNLCCSISSNDIPSKQIQQFSQLIPGAENSLNRSLTSKPGDSLGSVEVIGDLPKLPLEVAEPTLLSVFSLALFGLVVNRKSKISR